MNLDFDKLDGLIPVIVQHHTTGEVLMLGFGNTESMRLSADSGELWLYSRSRRTLWHKGQTSGNTQTVISITPDCDGDAVLIRVRPNGPVCHTGTRSCFAESPTLRALADVIAARFDADPSESYTSTLFRDENKRLKKLGEEAVELALACQEGNREHTADEAADLIYHILVASAAAGASLDDILARLEERRAKSGVRAGAE